MTVRCDCCARTDIGGRSSNQDHFLVADLITAINVEETSIGSDHFVQPDSRLAKVLAVADGMGGHAAGEVASRFVMKTLISEFAAQPMRFYGVDDKAAELALEQTIGRCQVCLRTHAAERPELKGMGTTLTLALIEWPRLIVAHVGDSRAYLIRESCIRQLTRDHTLGAQVAASGFCRPDQVGAQLHHVLLNCIEAGESRAQPEFVCTNLRAGDSLLLCTDGLVGGDVDEQMLLQILSDEGDPDAVCDRLVHDAKARQATDNMTAVVARFRQSSENVEVDSESGNLADAVDPSPDRLKSTSDWPSQCVA